MVVVGGKQTNARLGHGLSGLNALILADRDCQILEDRDLVTEFRGIQGGLLDTVGFGDADNVHLVDASLCQGVGQGDTG